MRKGLCVVDKNKTALIGQFEGKASLQVLDGESVTAVWTDGVMLSADNGNTNMMPGNAPCAFKLKSGEQYSVAVSRVVADGEIITTDMLDAARKTADDAVKNLDALVAVYVLQNHQLEVGQVVEPRCLARGQIFPVVIESFHGYRTYNQYIKLFSEFHPHPKGFGWYVRARLLSPKGKELKYEKFAEYDSADFMYAQQRKSEETE
jgi:hypothetical protein